MAGGFSGTGGQVVDIELYFRLIREAMERRTIEYGQTGWHARTMGHLLDAINRYEHAHKRPMLSVIVVLAGTGKPGDVGRNFWQCAQELGRWDPSQDKKEFLAKERQAVWRTWGL